LCTSGAVFGSAGRAEQGKDSRRPTRQTPSRSIISVPCRPKSRFIGSRTSVARREVISVVVMGIASSKTFTSVGNEKHGVRRQAKRERRHLHSRATGSRSEDSSFRRLPPTALSPNSLFAISGASSRWIPRSARSNSSTRGSPRNGSCSAAATIRSA